MLQNSEKIRQARISAGLSQKEMADILMVSQQVYSNIENGRTKKISSEIMDAFNAWEI
jgi:transcriptional regulator with XRE-family HTH domain